MFQSFEEVADFVQAQAIKMIDLRFVDLWGHWRHVTVPAARFTQRLVEEGVGFDGSSLGFTSVSSGDMVVVPDLGTGFVDPFFDTATLGFICWVLEADTRDRFASDPRSVAFRAQEYLHTSGVADESLWGPEFEFFVFGQVSYQNDTNVSSYRIESPELIRASKELGDGYVIPSGGGYHITPPQDHVHDLRNRICMYLADMGVEIKYHHHEVGGSGHCEIETPLLPLVRAADVAMLIKYVVRMTASRAGMTATFLPKPMYGEDGSGMHCHQQLWKDGRNLFHDPDGYGTLSETARQYTAGLLHHGGAVMAFTNPSTNSYRRLVPGHAAPIRAIFSLGNRSAAIRIPKYANQPHSTRIEFRAPDATSNPYLALTAQLLAGIDGVLNRMDPTALGFGPIDENIWTWPAEKQARIKSLPTGLEEALNALQGDRGFLLANDIVGLGLIEQWIERKRWESRQVQVRPHPYEIELYYNL